MKNTIFVYRILIIVSVLLIASTTVFAEKSPRQPNVVIILADDLGYGDLACYGHPAFKTPHLDRMAAEGVRLTQFNTPNPFCAPTRASLLTGRYPFRCGLVNNPAPDGDRERSKLIALPENELTLAQLFRDAGYTTGMIGKWHLGHAEKQFYPVRRGFDEYLGILYSNDMRPIQLIEDEEVVEYPVAQTTLMPRYTERALSFIERNKQKPFFLYFAHAMPHKPLAPSEVFYKKSGAGIYGDVIAELDASVGKVLARLKELGLDENTLVFFTSDNGPWFGGSTGGLRGMKATAYEGGYRVPCIARWPGRIPAGKTCDALGVTMDLFTTSLAAAEIPNPSDRVIDGVNLLPTFESNDKKPHQYVYGLQGPVLASVRDANWKLHFTKQRRPVAIVDDQWVDRRAPDGVTILAPYEQYRPSAYPGIKTGDESEALALYHLAEDPSEQKNVASQHPEIVARLKQRYDLVTKEFPTLHSLPASIR